MLLNKHRHNGLIQFTFDLSIYAVTMQMFSDDAKKKLFEMLPRSETNGQTEH